MERLLALMALASLAALAPHVQAQQFRGYGTTYTCERGGRAAHAPLARSPLLDLD